MKKFYVSLLALTVALGSNAQKLSDTMSDLQVNSAKQADVSRVDAMSARGGLNCPFTEGFNAGYPGSWSTEVTNTNGADYTWGYTSTGGNPGGAMTMQYDPALALQNESIITGDIDLSAVATPGLYFDWLMSYYWGVAPNNNYDLTVSISTNGGVSWVPLWTEQEEGEFDNFTWYTKAINLAAYANETAVRFRFNYYGTDGAQASIDNINICTLPSQDLALTYVYHGDVIGDYVYTKIPLAQTTEVIAGFIVRNNGVSDLTNLQVNWAVTLSGSNVATGTANGPALSVSGQVDTIWVSTGYTPSAVGTYTVTGTAAAAEQDEVSANNTLSSSFAVTQFTWAHDYESEQYGGYGYAANSANGAQGYQMGASYYAASTGGTIHAVDFALFSSTANPTTAQSLLVHIYRNELDAGPISTTVYDIMPGDLSTSAVNFITVPLQDPVVIEADKVYTATIEVEAGDAAYIMGNSIYDNDNSQAVYIGAEGSWFNWVGLTTSMRLNLDPSVGIAENADLTGIQMFPNPANDVLTVKFNSNEANDIRINIVSMDGKLVFTQNARAFSGQFTSRISLDGLSTGLYSVQVMSNNATYTQKVAVVK
jgi:hypothetical protein